MGLKRWRLKFSTGCIGVGSQLLHRKYQSHSKCPLCNTPGEKVSHVLHCPDCAATTFATARIKHHLTDELQALDTEPVLSAAILDILLSWRKGQAIIPIHFDSSIRAIITAQSHLGWDNFVLGRWCPAWRKFQAQHYTDIGSRRTSLHWATAIIHKLLLTAWDLWQYHNNRLHASAGPRELALHSSLDADIDTEYALGSAGLAADSCYLIDSVLLEDLHSDSLDGKHQWLLSVRAARKAFADQLGNTPPPPSAQAIRFRAWFGLPPA